VKTYAVYVLHLERALSDLEHSLSLVNPSLHARREKGQDWKEERRLAKTIMVGFLFFWTNCFCLLKCIAFLATGGESLVGWRERIGDLSEQASDEIAEISATFPGLSFDSECGHIARC
jgi:hypothetical protein